MIYEKKKLEKISFPLGGIGTGSVGLAGNGSFKDWEIFNRPNKGSYNGSVYSAYGAWNERIKPWDAPAFLGNVL